MDRGPLDSRNTKDTMGQPQAYTPEKLIVGLLLAPSGTLASVMKLLEERFGALDYRSSAIPFRFTNYYEPEMGAPLTRYFVAVKSLRDPQELSAIKLETNQIERELAGDGGRTANVDPGMLSQSNLVLATTKPFAHRIPLMHGIYGEVTLLYEKGDYRPQPWTYPDYASEEYREIFRTIRDLYRTQL